MPLSEFYNILGGEVRTDRILVPNLSNIMDELGHNRLPPSFSGKPDDYSKSTAKNASNFCWNARCDGTDKNEGLNLCRTG